MKCVRCGHDSKYKERTARKCPKCRGEFAFEPRTGDPVTDPAFKNAIDTVSAEGRLRWGVEHLYYEVARRYRRAKAIGPGAVLAGALGGTFIAVFIAGSVDSAIPFLIATPLGAGLGAMAWLASDRKTVRLVLPRFNKLWERWQKIHGVPAGVIVRPKHPPAPRALEPDVGDYSFDRAVICDRARTVDLLLANNFHFENNCAVLSADGYPRGPFETVRAMLRRNPRLQVFVLHDATPAGCRLAHELADDPAWFKGRVPVIDVGLRPGHSRPFEGLFLPAAAAGGAGAGGTAGRGISADEAQWLAQYRLEVAAIRPEQVLKRLFRAINRKSDAEPDAVATSRANSGNGGSSSSGDGGTWTSHGAVEQDIESFGTDAGDSDGGADSFG